MVNVNDLRIGNNVMLETTTSVYELVDGLQTNKSADHVRCIHIAGNGLWNYEAQIFGIPLTTELLEKCGFELINHINGYSFWSMKSTHKKREPKISIYDTRTEYMGYTVAHVVSIHQLQNLYFALTGTELEIKL